MQLKKLTIQAPVGLYYVTHPELLGANVISVKRNGSRQYLISELPTGTLPNVQHNGAEGRLYFSQSLPFNYSILDEVGNRLIEYVFVIYTNGGGVIVPTPPIGPVDPEPPPPPEPVYNFRVQSGFDQDGNSIITVSPAVYVSITGLLPIVGVGDIRGIHYGFTAALTIRITQPESVTNGRVTLYRDFDIVECKNVISGTHDYTFSSITALVSEKIRLFYFDDGPCA